MAKVPLYVSNEKAYVWTVEDVTELRVRHRICGTLSGTLPHLSQQNFFLGLPLLLMPEEVVLLVENGKSLWLAVIVDDTKAIRAPSPAELAEWEEDRKQEVDQQISLWFERDGARLVLEATNSEGKGRMSEAAVQKRDERQKRKTYASLPPTFPLRNEPSLGIVASNTQHTQREAQIRPQPNFTVRIPSTSQSQPWYQPSIYDDLSSAKHAGIWTYPRTPEERASCSVFRDLWGKGHFLGSGIKFGGNFLVYPGDPLRYHSHFVASVLPSPSSIIRPMEIVAHGRLGTATKKSHLLCGWDESTDEVSYLSIEWAGFG
ncbi:tRNA-intron endonuclease catalytic domain-like protein [Ramaria rubella]|nr:tRNA-intron endonuclease catalytic domain-like protein [Ramaria rubella]